MPTISYTVSSGVVSGGSLSAVVDYTVSSTNTQTTFTFGAPAIKWTKPASVALQWKFTFVGGNTAVEGADYTLSGSVFPAAGTSGQTTGTPNGLTVTWNRKTSDWVIPLKLEILEGTGSGTSYTYNSRGSKTTKLTVPAIPSYDVTYNANGHGTAPASQKKYYGTTLKLASAMAASGWKFVRWNTSSDDSGTGYNAGASYTANAALSLYAIWKRTISGVSIGSATVIRTEDATSTEESDEGEYAYISVPYSVTGAAAANITMQVTATADSGTAPTVTIVSGQTTKEADATKSGTFTARASVCSPDVRYSFTITITATNTSDTQTAVTATRTLVLASAFFLVDFKAGGKGVHFGGSATEDGFFVSMPATFYTTVKATGNITVEKANAPNYVSKSTGVNSDIGATVPSSSNVQIGGFVRYDLNGYSCFYSETYKTTADTVYTSFVTRRRSADQATTYSHGFYMNITNTGAMTVTFTNNTSRDAWATGLNVVKKAGDTMTGDLAISKAIPYVNTTHTGLDLKQANNGISSTQYAGLQVKDKNGYVANYFGLVAVTGGNVTAELVAYNRNTSGSQTGANYIQATVAKDGTASYAVSNQAAFRNAIGASSGVWTAAMIPSLDASKIGSGTLGIARGGTGTTTGIKGWTSLGSTTATTAKAITASSYTEILVVMAYSTTYRGSCFIPVAALSTTANEWYCGGGNKGGSSTSGRRGVFKATTTAITPVLVTINGTDYSNTSVVTYIYAR